MRSREFLTWYLGAVLFVGTAGASGYQVLSRHPATQAADTGPIPTMVAAEAPGVNAPAVAVQSTPYNIADAKPLRHSQVVKPGAGHAARPAERRPGTRLLAAHHPAAAARHVPPLVTSQYVAPVQPVRVYAQVPVTAYPGYPAYRPGYVYYYPRYYRVH